MSDSVSPLPPPIGGGLGGLETRNGGGGTGEELSGIEYDGGGGGTGEGDLRNGSKWGSSSSSSGSGTVLSLVKLRNSGSCDDCVESCRGCLLMNWEAYAAKDAAIVV